MNGRAVYRVAEDYRTIPGGTPGPIILVGWSPDSRWLLFSIDPMSSASLAADGLGLRRSTSRPAASSGHHHAPRYRLPHLVRLDARPDRGQRPPGDDDQAPRRRDAHRTGSRAALWRRPEARLLARLACAPDGKSVAVLSQPASLDSTSSTPAGSSGGSRSTAHTRSSTARRLGSPTSRRAGRATGNALLFVREHKGYGQLMLLRDDSVTGPIANLGYSLGLLRPSRLVAGARGAWARDGSRPALRRPPRARGLVTARDRSRRRSATSGARSAWATSRPASSTPSTSDTHRARRPSATGTRSR